MLKLSLKGMKRIHWSLLSSVLTFAFLIVGMILGDSQPAYTLPIHKVNAVPAFARKYGLPCSACHTAWPKLNDFGTAFRDRGYQIGNDRDSPIWQNPSYFPMTARITPQWHLEHTTNQQVDSIPGGGTGSALISTTVTQHGFDLSGMDFWLVGTLFKDVSFSLLPSSDPTAVWHFENAFVRFDNLKGSSWFNLKFGHFELNELISEKRFLFLSANGGLYQSYHFIPPGDSNNFGLGDNESGIELMGHNANSYTRYSVAVLSSNEGGVNFTTDVVPGAPPAGRTYDFYGTFDQAFQVSQNAMGASRIQGYVYIGERPTYYQTSNGTQLYGIGNKPFYRVGVASEFYIGKLDIMPFYMHAHDNVFLGTSTPSNSALPTGAQSPSWNAGFVEFGYYYSPQFVFIGRYEAVRMQTQALPTNASNLGNIDAYSIGSRWYPIMFSRAGLALHTEYSITKSVGIVPLSGDGVGLPPVPTASGSPAAVWSSSLMVGFDFDF
ncbi:MAG: hypothetical protein WBL70_03810 [Candidatus Acidiferrales bacterium]